MTSRIRTDVPKPAVSSGLPAASPKPATAPATPAPAAGWNAGGAAPKPASTGFDGAVSRTVANTINTLGKNTGPSDYALIPGKLNDAVGLPDLLAKMASSPEGQAAANQVLDQLATKAGLSIAPDVRAAILANPTLLTKALEVTPKEMAAGVVAMNAAYKAGKIPPVAPRVMQLPQHFDFANLASTPIPREQPELKQVAPGLFQGDLPSDAPDAEVKNNTAMAEVLQRLSSNLSAPADQQFDVTFNGQKYTRTDDFLGALKKAGYEVNVEFDQRIANFSDLKTPVPGSNPPKWLDVPAPLMVKTGVVDAMGKEAVVPASHSEMVVTIKSGPSSPGPKLDSQVKYYQGINSTGFFPANTTASPTWCGKVSHGTLSGDQATRAIALAGDFTDVVHSSAKALGLYADGYGVTGVCNDSVAVIEQAMTGTAHEYPLLMNDSTLMGEVQRRIASDPRDAKDFQALKKAIVALPSDASPNASAASRALSSLPWAKGEEPFASTVDARKILGG